MSFSEILYHTLRVFLEGHVADIAKELSNVDSADFLAEYVRQWSQYSFGAEGSEPLFDYLVSTSLFASFLGLTVVLCTGEALDPHSDLP